jgi:hypothetical protein
MGVTFETVLEEDEQYVSRKFARIDECITAEDENDGLKTRATK